MKISLVSEKVSASKSELSGTGTFAEDHIRAGERIGIFGGYVIPINSLDRMRLTDPQSHDVIMRTGFMVDDDAIFSPIADSQFSDIEWMNHSCAPNCGFNWSIHLIALRDIDPGEELTIDYAMCITSDIFSMECSCGSEDCRSFISGSDWKIPSLQAAYAGRFQPYIEAKFPSGGGG